MPTADAIAALWGLRHLLRCLDFGVELMAMGELDLWGGLVLMLQKEIGGMGVGKRALGGGLGGLGDGFRGVWLLVGRGV